MSYKLHGKKNQKLEFKIVTIQLSCLFNNIKGSDWNRLSPPDPPGLHLHLKDCVPGLSFLAGFAHQVKLSYKQLGNAMESGPWGKERKTKNPASVSSYKLKTKQKTKKKTKAKVFIVLTRGYSPLLCTSVFLHHKHHH